MKVVSKSNKLKDKSSAHTSDRPANKVITAASYALGEQGGRRHGRDVEHWLKAEVRIRQDGTTQLQAI